MFTYEYENIQLVKYFYRIYNFSYYLRDSLLYENDQPKSALNPFQTNTLKKVPANIKKYSFLSTFIQFTASIIILKTAQYM